MNYELGRVYEYYHFKTVSKINIDEFTFINNG